MARVIDGDIRVRGLRKVFRQKGSGVAVLAIERLDFTVTRGEIVAIVGKTGCGKSTFFNILIGLEHPSDGRVTIGDRTPYGDFDDFRGRIGIIFQQDRLLPWRTLRDNVTLGLEIMGLDPAEQRARAEQWLHRLGLDAFLRAFPAELSGGMRQRAALARAFAVNPEILLADEAFGHLDEVTARQIRGEFFDMVRAERKTAIHVTHQLEEANDSHMDTTIHKDEWWTTRRAADPVFHSAWREVDVLVGNGVCNDKGPMATWLCAAKAIKASGVRLKGDLVLMASRQGRAQRRAQRTDPTQQAGL